MAWPLVAALAVSAAAKYAGDSANAKSGRKQSANQLAAEKYNAQIGYETDLNNIAMRGAVTQANLNNLLAANELSVATTDMMTEFNASLINSVALYNDSLFEKDLENVWAQAGLDTTILSTQRERERGSMIAAQSASGTVIGTGSNADALVDQMSQEAMEVFIIKTGAADKAATITNARMQSLYQARQEIAKLEFEGSMKNTVDTATTVMKGQSIITENYLQSATDITNANTKLQTGISTAEANNATNQLKISNAFTTGMFDNISSTAKGAASIYASSAGAK